MLRPSASGTGGTYCLHLHHLPEELTASICITYRRNFSASTCISTYRRNLPPSAGRPLNASISITYGRNLLHLHNVSEERTTSICVTYRRNFNASTCISTYWRNLPPSASHTGGTCLHLHHLPEELASICITYRRNLPPSAGRPLNASICITYGRNLLHLHNVSEELATSICITYRRNFNAFICTTYRRNSRAFICTTYHCARTCHMLLQTLPEFTVPYSTCLQAIFRLFELPNVTVKIQQRILTSVLSERCVLSPLLPKRTQNTCPHPSPPPVHVPLAVTHLSYCDVRRDLCILESYFSGRPTV